MVVVTEAIVVSFARSKVSVSFGGTGKLLLRLLLRVGEPTIDGLICVQSEHVLVTADRLEVGTSLLGSHERYNELDNDDDDDDDARKCMRWARLLPLGPVVTIVKVRTTTPLSCVYNIQARPGLTNDREETEGRLYSIRWAWVRHKRGQIYLRCYINTQLNPNSTRRKKKKGSASKTEDERVCACKSMASKTSRMKQRCPMMLWCARGIHTHNTRRE